ncbi:MAG: acyl-CoA dehydrogenase protein [Acidimicrobiales bacterium]|nr:acyl-CoA dehydrogenase protein [Acidimicrobiales bacterium]
MLLPPSTPTAAEDALRRDVRAFLAEVLPRGSYRPGLGIAASADREFSRKVGERGWLGMSIPRHLGGGGRTAVERYVVAEELLAAGAPVMSHWVADRQTGTAFARYGTADLQQRFLPGIVSGEISFSLGFSEPDAGSDLAAVRTAATRADGGWLLNGVKVWTSGAHVNDYVSVLCRTDPTAERHQGLTMLVVDLRSPGVVVRPIILMDGSHHLNEVVFTDVFVGDENVLGGVGMGWTQVTSELAFERAGPDRFLTVQPVLEAVLRELDVDPLGAADGAALGGLVARMWAIRQLSLSVNRLIDQGQEPAVHAALVKDLGTSFEQEAVEVLSTLTDDDLDPSSPSSVIRLLAEAVTTAPSFTLRGGTNEVLRGLVAKSLRAEGGRSPIGEPLLQESLERLLSNEATPSIVRQSEEEGWIPTLWSALAAAGVPWVGLDADIGGSGGSMDDVFAILRMAGYAGAPVPIAETAVLAGWMLQEAGLELPGGPITIAPGAKNDHVQATRLVNGSLQLTGRFERVPWGRVAERLVVLCAVDRGNEDQPDDLEGEMIVISVPIGLSTIERGCNIAGEPRDTLTFDHVTVEVREFGRAPVGLTASVVSARGAVCRAALISGACQAALDLSVAHTAERRQFGQPIGRFQAVQQQLARAAGETALAGTAAMVAMRSVATDPHGLAVAAATVAARRAARVVAATAHQVHGAIGVTREYDLQLHTRRLASWSRDYGSERAWSIRVATLVAQAGADGVWPLITGTGPAASTA